MQIIYPAFYRQKPAQPSKINRSPSWDSVQFSGATIHPPNDAEAMLKALETSKPDSLPTIDQMMQASRSDAAKIRVIRAALQKPATYPWGAKWIGYLDDDPSKLTFIRGILNNQEACLSLRKFNEEGAHNGLRRLLECVQDDDVKVSLLDPILKNKDTPGEVRGDAILAVDTLQSTKLKISRFKAFFERNPGIAEAINHNEYAAFSQLKKMIVATNDESLKIALIPTFLEGFGLEIDGVNMLASLSQETDRANFLFQRMRQKAQKTCPEVSVQEKGLLAELSEPVKTDLAQRLLETKAQFPASVGASLIVDLTDDPVKLPLIDIALSPEQHPTTRALALKAASTLRHSPVELARIAGIGIRDREAFVRQEAPALLEQVTDESLLIPLRQAAIESRDRELQRLALAKLVPVTEIANRAKVLVRASISHVPDVRKAGQEGLKAFTLREWWTPYYTELLKSLDEKISKAAAENVALVLDCIVTNRDDSEIVSIACRLLSKYGRPQYSDSQALEVFLHIADEKTRAIAILELLKQHRVSAAKAICNISDPALRAMLIEKAFEEETYATWEDPFHMGAVQAIAAFRHQPDKLLFLIQKGMRLSSVDVRQALIQEVQYLSEPSADHDKFRIIDTAARDPRSKVRHEAILAATSLYSTDLQNKIVRPLLEDPDYDVRKTAVKRLLDLRGGEALALENLPYWLASPDSIKTLRTLFAVIDAEWYKRAHKKPKDPHPLEAELFLLLRHPQMETAELWKPAVKAITAPYAFIVNAKGLEIDSIMLKNWRDVGLLTHDFKRWRWDTVGGMVEGKSLFEHYGFRPQPDAMDQELARILELDASAQRATDDIYGKGFLFKKAFQPSASIAPDTLIEFRRGYLLVSNPQHGTLVIRNSSKLFGRTLLEHPAFYMPQRLSETELRDFDPRQQEGLQHILEPALNQQPEFHTKLRKLLDELMAVRDDYSRWKFDVAATEPDGTTMADLSPGFAVLLELLSKLQKRKENDKPPTSQMSLNVVDPNYPVYSPIRQYLLTPEHVRELETYRTGRMSDEAILESDIYKLFDAAIDLEQAELVITEEKVQ